MDRKFVIGIVLVFLVGLLVYAISMGVQAVFDSGENDNRPLEDNAAASGKFQDAVGQGNTE
jgi:hypothetical protein